jgi:hypothetical protein
MATLLDYRTVHPTYPPQIAQWQKLRTVAGGRDLLIQGGGTYLPKPTAMADDRYQVYLNRAKWFGATQRTVQAFGGLAFRQPLSTAVPPSLLPHLQLLTQTGLDLTTLARLIFSETLLMGRYGVLVDYDAGGNRPYWAGYPAENILNWTVEMIEGEWIVTSVALREFIWVPLPPASAMDQGRATPPGPVGSGGAPALSAAAMYGVTQMLQEQVRLLQLIDGVYTQTLFIYNIQGLVIEAQEVVSQRQEAPLPFIPFVFFSATDLEPAIQDSPLNDLADTNLAYWRHSADYEWALHLTANPTLWITGHDPSLDVGPDGTPQTEVVLGADMAIILREPDAKVGMLEFHGLGLEPIRSAMLDDKQEMASLGARLLEGLPETPETLGAVRLRQLGDTSVLVALTQTLSAGLSRLLQYHAYWFGAASVPDDPRVRTSLATSFVTKALDAQTLTALMAAVQAGHISHETWYYNLQQADFAEPGITFEEEQARIESAQPAMARLFTRPVQPVVEPLARHGTAGAPEPYGRNGTTAGAPS